MGDYMAEEVPSKDVFESLPIQEEAFEDLYQEFHTIEELTKSKEWEETWKYYYSFTNNELSIVPGETLDEINAYSLERQREEIIKCATDFFYFCHKYFKIAHPMKGSLPFIPYGYQRRVITSYENNRFNILSKFRQGGLTTVSVAWAVWRCLFRLDQKIMVMSKTDREAIAAGEVARKGMEELPDWLQPQMGKHNDHERQFKDTGSVLWFYTPEAARGKSITVLIIDEAAFIQDMHKHWKAMYPVISTGGSCCVVSTVNGLGNWYEEVYHEAEAGDNAFRVVDMDYWEHPEYNNPRWVADTKANLGDKGWQQEVLRSFLGSGETYISPNIIGELDQFTRDNAPLRVKFEKWANHGEERKLEWASGALWLWKEPLDGHEYILAADCAEGTGEGGDNSCLQILDAATLEQVAEFYSNTVPPHIFAQVIFQMATFYNTALVVVESQFGGAVLSNLQHDLAYENLFYEPKKARQNMPGLKTSTTNRPIFLQALQHRLMNGSVRINSRRFVNELKTFIYNAQKKKAEAQKGKHDDAIMALSLALFVRDSQMRGIPVGAEVPEEMIQVFKSEVFEEIKKEIMEGSPEDWIAEDDEKDPFDTDGNILPGVSFTPKRKKDKLLKEFGW